MDLKFCWSNQDLSKKETKRTQIKLLLIDGFKVLLVNNNNNNNNNNNSSSSGHAIFVWVPRWDTGALFDAAQFSRITVFKTDHA